MNHGPITDTTPLAPQIAVWMATNRNEQVVMRATVTNGRDVIGTIVSCDGDVEGYEGDASIDTFIDAFVDEDAAYDAICDRWKFRLKGGGPAAGEAPAEPDSVPVRFLQMLRPGGPWVLIAIVPDGKPTVITARTADEIDDFVRKYDGKRNLYYQVNPTRTAMTKKAAKTDIPAIEYILGDCDPADGETSEAAKARYLEQINGAFDPKPTAAIDSGNGIQLLVRLKERITLGQPVNGEFSAEDQAKIDDAEARSAAMMRRLGAEAGTQNIDRILRLPGTTNLPNAKKRKAGRIACQTGLLWFNNTSYPLDALPRDGASPKQHDSQFGAFPERDESGSGHGFRFMQACHGKGMDFEQARAAILDDKNEAGEWANRVDQRQLERAWERSKPKDEKYTDLGNARRLVRLHGDNIRYVAAWKSWLAWRDGHWRRDDDGEIMRLAKATVEGMYTEAAAIADEDARKALRSHAMKCQSAQRLAAMVELAKTERAVILPVSMVDTDPLLLGVENGVVDLRTGGFRPAEREDYVTKRCGVAFDPSAKCPNWDAFLRRIFNAAPAAAEIAAVEAAAAKAETEAETAESEATAAEAELAVAETKLAEAETRLAEAQAKELAKIKAETAAEDAKDAEIIFKLRADTASASAELTKSVEAKGKKWSKRNKIRDKAQDSLDRKTTARARAKAARSEVERLRRAPKTAAGLIAYIRRACGYTLTGLTDEEVMFFLWGTGSNGKSTLRETIFMLMGDYAMGADASLLIAHNKQKGATPDVARLHGKRLVAVNETQEGDQLNESRVKFITSHDTITGRALFENFFDFTPTHKAWVTTNDKPIIKGTDLGIWRRVELWAFLVTIPKEERDRYFRQKYLMPELSGILNWALRGLRKYHLLGLKPPSAVMAATEEYREDMDVLGQWIKERLVCDPTHALKRTDLYTDYKIWSEANVGWCLKAIGFGRKLAKREDLDLVEATVERERGWRGVRLRSPTPMRVVASH